LKASILLVEDNPRDEKLTIRAFNQANIANRIVVARDGADALDYLFGRGQYQGRDVSAFPAVVLLDLKLPKIDGLDVLREIRADARTKLLPVVILTASREEEDRARGYALGVNAFVRKPIAFAEFAEAVKTLGLFWVVLNEGPPAAGVA
jgi:two-component system, response regulator